jgi:uncharacterized protein (TIGR02186 family)
MRGFLTAVLFMLAGSGAAQAERLASTVSTTNVEINSSFDGAALSLFGNILPDLESPQKYVEGPYHVIIVVTGPLQDRVARMKTNTWGIWTNAEQVLFKAFPSYYAVTASARLADITTPENLAALAIPPEQQAEIAAGSNSPKARRFGTALVRMLSEEGHLSVNEDGVRFLSDTAYTARIVLPSDVVNGAFVAHTYVFKAGVLVADKTDGFGVRKSGFERFVFISAQQQPLLYGLACVILALGTGWLAGVVFRR